MNQENKNWEAETFKTEKINPPMRFENNSKKVQKILNKIKDWYNTLPTPGKAAVVVGGLIFGVSILNTVLQLVTSILSVAILGIVVYVLYKYLIANQSSSEK